LAGKLVVYDQPSVSIWVIHYFDMIVVCELWLVKFYYYFTARSRTTALHFAVFTGKAEFVGILLKNGSQVYWY